MSLDALIFELDQRGVVLQEAGDRIDFKAPAGALTPELRQQLAEHKPDILAYLRSQILAADELREVSQDQAKALAVLAAQVAHELPEVAHPAEDTGTCRIEPEDLLPDSTTATDTCHCCGQAQWWDKAGRRTCQVCHPRPEDSQGPSVAPKWVEPEPSGRK